MNKMIIGAIVVVVLVVGIGLAVMHHATMTPSSSMAKSTSSGASATSSQAASAAGNVAITGGTNGAACDSGGYFKPSSVTINSGETITFSVPANDPYAGGLQVNGLPQGNLVIARGGSATTSPITTSVSFNGTWPDDTACKKGSGTITVK